MTAGEFKAARPEFAAAPDALVTARLAVAENQCPERVWSDPAKRKEAIELLTARSLALTPEGRGMRLESDNGKTIYDDRLHELRRIVAGGPKAIF